MKSELAPFFYDSSNTDKREEVIDYFMSWTLRCAESQYVKSENNKVHTYAKRILSIFLFNDVDYLNNKNVVAVKTWKQSQNTDIWAEIEIEHEHEPQKYALVIENKLYAHLGEHQLPDYKEKAFRYYSDKSDFRIKLAFLRCDDKFNEKDELMCEQNEFVPFLLKDIKATAITDGLTNNHLFDEFWFYWWGY